MTTHSSTSATGQDLMRGNRVQDTTDLLARGDRAMYGTLLARRIAVSGALLMLVEWQNGVTSLHSPERLVRA